MLPVPLGPPAAAPFALEASRALSPEALGTPSLVVRRQGGIVKVTISRPSHANAYDAAMLCALEDLVPALSAQVRPEPAPQPDPRVGRSHSHRSPQSCRPLPSFLVPHL